MSSDVVVIASIGAQNPAQMRHTQDDEMIHALALDRSDQPFGKAILPGRAWCSRFVPDAHRAQSACNDGAIDREARVVPRASCVRPKGSGVHARACNQFYLVTVEPGWKTRNRRRGIPRYVEHANAATQRQHSIKVTEAVQTPPYNFRVATTVYAKLRYIHMNNARSPPRNRRRGGARRKAMLS